MLKDNLHNKQNLHTSQSLGATFFLNCALKDAIPKINLLDIKAKYRNKVNSIDLSQNRIQISKKTLIAQKEYARDIHDLLNANIGSTLLQHPDISRNLLARIESFHQKYYKLLALSIMPNHFRMVIDLTTPVEETDKFKNLSTKDQVEKIAHLIKSGSSRYINHWRSTAADQVWESDYFDLQLGDTKMLKEMMTFIEQSPVKGGLVAAAGEHPFTIVNWDLLP